MPELEVVAVDRQQPGPLGVVEGSWVDAQQGAGAGDEQDVLGIVGRRHEQRPTRLVGQSPHPLVERRLELFGQWQTFGQRFGTGQLGVGERSRELDEGQRVAARLVKDAFGDRGRGAVRRAAQEQRRRGGIEWGQRQRREVGALEAADVAVASAEQQGDAVARQSAGDEPQRLGRRGVEPVGVVGQAQDGPLVGQFGEHGEARREHEEALPARTDAGSEGVAERSARALREGIEGGLRRPQELVQAGEGQFGLRFDASCAEDEHVRRTMSRLVQNSRLAGAGWSPHDERATIARPGGVEQSVDDGQLGVASVEHRPMVGPGDATGSVRSPRRCISAITRDATRRRDPASSESDPISGPTAATRLAVTVERTTSMTAPTMISRRELLRRVGLGAGTVAVIGAGGLAYRAYDQGVLEVGQGAAYQPWNDWQDGTGTTRLVRAAILAPSPHNAQGWQFAAGRRHVDVFADLGRGTGALDPFLRELHVGLGAAIENVVLTGRALGLAPTVLLLPSGSTSNHVAHVAVADGPRQPSDLAAQIPHRHTNRYPFATGTDVPPAALDAMDHLADRTVPEVRLIWLTGSLRAQMSELLVAATAAIVDDPDQQASDARWFRQRWDDIQRQRDGVTIDTAGLPDLTATLAKLLPAQSQRAAGAAWLDATRDRQTRTAAAYGIVAVRDARDRVQQLEGGRLLQRVHLWATGQGLALHHMNQVTERADREVQLGIPPQFGDALGHVVPSGWQALSTFRIGHPTRQPRRSPRRPIEAVLVP